MVETRARLQEADSTTIDLGLIRRLAFIMKSFGQFIHQDKSIVDPKAAKKNADLVPPDQLKGASDLFPLGSQLTGKGELFPPKKKIESRQLLKEAKKKVSKKKTKPKKVKATKLKK